MPNQRGVTQTAVIFILAAIIVIGGAFGAFQMYQQAQTKADSQTDAKIADLEQKLADLVARESTTTSVAVETPVQAQATDTSKDTIKELASQLEALKKQKSKPAPVVPTPIVVVPAPIVTSTTAAFSAIDLAAKVKKSVVFIDAGAELGSGFAVSPSLIITNHHVVKDSYAVKIKSSGAADEYAYVVGFDDAHDIALLQTDSAHFQPLSFTASNKDALPVGTQVFVFGYPFGEASEASFKEGTLSRRLTNSGTEYLEVSAELHEGNSGGPIVNTAGQVIGVSVATLGTQISGVSTGDSLKLAIPADSAASAYNGLSQSLKSYGNSQKKYARELVDYYQLKAKLEGDFAKAKDLFSKAQELNSDDPALEADPLFVSVSAQINYIRDKNNGVYPADASFGQSIDSALGKLDSIAKQMHSVTIPSQLKVDRAIKMGANDVAYNEQQFENARIKEFNTSLSSYGADQEKIQQQIKSYFGL